MKSEHEKRCETCKVLFTKKINTSKKAWEKTRYCSRSCINKGRVGWLRGKKRPYKSPGDFKKGHTPWNKGIKVRKTRDENNGLWKGTRASLVAKHAWVVRRLGKPKECVHCGTTEDRMYHWANISGTYKRDTSDYIRLCVPCHKRYDLKKLKDDKTNTRKYRRH